MIIRRGDPVETWLRRIGFKNLEIQNYLDGKSVDWADMVFRMVFVRIIMQSISGKTKRGKLLLVYGMDRQ